MSDELPMIHTGPSKEEPVDENEKLRIRKNCMFQFGYFTYSNACKYPSAQPGTSPT